MGQQCMGVLTIVSILEEEAQLHFHGVPSAAVDDLPLAGIALRVVLQELHDLSANGVIHAAGHTNVQEHLCATKLTLSAAVLPPLQPSPIVAQPNLGAHS